MTYFSDHHNNDFKVKKFLLLATTIVKQKCELFVFNCAVYQFLQIVLAIVEITQSSS